MALRLTTGPTLAIGAVVTATVVLGSALAGHAIAPRVQVRSVPTMLPPSTVTASVTISVTATATKEKPVVVPSPVYVTVTPIQQPMSQLEARAYCEQLAVEAWPDGTTTGDPMLDQAGRAYTDLQRRRAFDGCMTDHGY